MTDPEIKPASFTSGYDGTCGACGERYYAGDQIVRNFAGHGFIHEDCYVQPEQDPTKQTLDEHYNALCQTLDRIMTGNPKITVRGGARSSVAETLHDDTGYDRAVVKFDHRRIKAWSKNGFDRTALTLALNIHELGHIWHSPSAGGAGRRGIDANVRKAFNMLEDQRQEILTALQYPRAVDYLRYLNARGLQLAIKQGFIGRSFLIQYGRRHLYPQSVNTRLEAEALLKYGPDTLRQIKSIIDEFLRLALPENINRAWQLAKQLAKIDLEADPPWRTKDDFNEGDPRHNCVPTSGTPTLDPQTKDRLTRKIRRLVQRPTATKEPEHKEPEDDEKQEGMEKAPEANLDEASGDDSYGEDTTGGERSEDAGEELSETQEQTPETGDEPEEEGLEPEPEFGDEGLAEPQKEEKEDETLDGMYAGKDSQPEESTPDTPTETEGKQEGERSERETSPGETPDEGPLADAEVEGDGGDNQADEGGEPDESSKADSGKGAGRGSSGPTEIEEKLAETLQDLEDAALDRVKDEVNNRHVALKSSELMPSLGGTRRGALNPLYKDAARRTGRLFEDINQDLKAVTRRSQRRGRLDSRRVITAITSNNQRIFKRRLKDLTPEAALAVHIFIDTSGSMDARVGINGETMKEIALPAGFALAKAIEMAGHLAKVTTFASDCTDQKDWLDENYRAWKVETGGTYPAEGLKKAIASFIYVEKELDIHNHVLIIITDGDLNDPEDSIKYLREMTKGGVYVIEIGIGVDPIPLQGAWKVMNIKSVNHLARALTEPLAKLSIEIAKNVRRKIA
jgi:hypothetical protein